MNWLRRLVCRYRGHDLPIHLVMGPGHHLLFCRRCRQPIEVDAVLGPGFLGIYGSKK